MNIKFVRFSHLSVDLQSVISFITTLTRRYNHALQIRMVSACHNWNDHWIAIVLYELKIMGIIDFAVAVYIQTKMEKRWSQKSISLSNHSNVWKSNIDDKTSVWKIFNTLMLNLLHNHNTLGEHKTSFQFGDKDIEFHGFKLIRKYILPISVPNMIRTKGRIYFSFNSTSFSEFRSNGVGVFHQSHYSVPAYTSKDNKHFSSFQRKVWYHKIWMQTTYLMFNNWII